MSIARVIAVAGLAAGSLLAALPACAQVSQFYVGGSYGRSKTDSSVAEGLITSGTVDTKATGFKIFGGWQFHPGFAAELAYVDLGELSYSGSFSGAPVTGGKIKSSGLDLAVAGRYRVTDSFSLIGKLGLFAWKSEASDTTGGAPFSDSVSGRDLSFGLGLGYDFTRSIGTRAEWQRFKIAGSDFDLATVGVLYRF